MPRVPRGVGDFLLTRYPCRFTRWSAYMLFDVAVVTTAQSVTECAVPYRGTSLMRKRTPLGPNRRPMPRALRWS